MKFNELVTLLEELDETVNASSYDSTENNIHIGKTIKFYTPEGRLTILFFNEDVAAIYIPKHITTDKDGMLHSLDDNYALDIFWTFDSITEDDFIERSWYKHGKLHRLSGPARIFYYDKTGEIEKKYYINGVQYTKEEFDEYIKGLDSKEDIEMLSDLGQTFD